MLALAIVLALLGAWELYARLGGVDDVHAARARPGRLRRCGTTAACCGTTCWSPPGGRARPGARAGRRRRPGAGAASLGRDAPRRLPAAGRLQAVPISMIAPLLVVWFGFGLLPKLVIVALVCFFPIVVTTLDALRRVDPEQHKLMRTLGASRWQTFRCVEAPGRAAGRAQRARRSPWPSRVHRRRLRRALRLRERPRPPVCQSSIPSSRPRAPRPRSSSWPPSRSSASRCSASPSAALVPWAHRRRTPIRRSASRPRRRAARLRRRRRWPPAASKQDDHGAPAAAAARRR